MKSTRPTKIIQLLSDMLNTRDRQEIGRLYIEVVSETLKSKFVEDAGRNLDNLIYKQMIRLSIKNYVHENQSQESIDELRQTIEILESTQIFSNE